MKEARVRRRRIERRRRRRRRGKCKEVGGEGGGVLTDEVWRISARIERKFSHYTC